MQFQISSRKEMGNEIPESSKLEFLEQFLANNFAFSDTDTSMPLNREIVQKIYPVENTTSNLPIVPRSKFLGSDRLFCLVWFYKRMRVWQLQEAFSNDY